MGSGGKSLPWNIRGYVYISHFLSTWGDRMWSFGVGLFMVIISPESLRLTAVYGLSMGGAILLFGALVGDWVDRTPRLSAARTTLIIQNTSVIICAVVVFVVVTFKADIQAVWPDEGLLTLCYVVIIVVAIVSRLGSMGTNIAVQRDWIVEICGRDKDMLASMSASLRRIDLTTKILAPIATGQIMYYASVGIGALFIAGWNLGSVFIEYCLLWKVYDVVPALKLKKYKSRKGKERGTNQQEETMIQPEPVELQVIGQGQSTAADANNLDNDTDEVKVANETGKLIEETKTENTISKTDMDDLEASNERETLEEDKSQNQAIDTPIEENRTECCACIWRMFSGILILVRGWKIYMKNDIAFAGLGLASLYMTVLGFDNITVGFAYSEGVNESVMGVLMAGGAVTGIIGTFLYPIIRKRIGLERTGLFSFFLEIAFLCLCVGSIWAPGSPFDPFYWKRGSMPNPVCVTFNDSSNTSNITSEALVTSVLANVSNVTSLNQKHNVKNITSVEPVYNVTGNYSNSLSGNVSMTTACETERDWQSYISVGLLMAGIIGARCGLWMADLTITQLFLENIDETERGIVNGVQASLNQLMDMVKFMMVVAAPQPEVFGFLILISFIFICIGWMLYAKYSYGVRGHLFHLEKIKCFDSKNNNVTRTSNGIEV